MMKHENIRDLTYIAVMAAVMAVCSWISIPVMDVPYTLQTMGVFLEMKVAMSIFFGGVLVTGGSSAKFYKIILGALSITIIVYGLSLMGMSDSHISQSVEGGLLLLILFITLLTNRRQKVREEPGAPAAAEAEQA